MWGLYLFFLSGVGGGGRRRRRRSGEEEKSNNPNLKGRETKETILSKNEDLGKLSKFPENICLGHFRKINWFYLVPWPSKKSEDQSGGPRTNLEVFGDEVSFQYFKKTWKSTSPMSCKTKPSQSSRPKFGPNWTPEDQFGGIW